MATASSNLDNFIAEGMDYGGIAKMYAAMPLKEYVGVWLKTFKSSSLKTASYSRLESSLVTLDDYGIAVKPIGEITAFDIQKYVNELTDRGYALSTIKKQMRIVTAPLRQAAAMHFIQADPSVGVKLPAQQNVKKQKKNINPYTEEEQKLLWAEIERSSRPGGLIIGLMLETGMRVGEALALRWKYVDIKRKRLRVEATMLNLANKKQCVLQESPKTISSRRVIPLTNKAIEILEKAQANAKNEYVFTNGRGEPLTYEALRYQTQQICKNADVEYRGEHVFRHTFATNCWYKNIDVKVLSKILGHSDVNVTYNIYISLKGDGFDEMYDALNRVS